MRLSTLVPVDELTLSDKRAFKQAAIDKGIERAKVRGIIGPNDEPVVRHPQNILDFVTNQEQWLTGALAAIGTNYTVFNNVAAPALPATRVCVWYGVIVETAPIPVSILRFRQGAGAGTTYAEMDLEQLKAELRPAAFFSEPLWYDPLEVMNIVVTAIGVGPGAGAALGVAAHIILLGWIIEPKGAVVSR